MEESPSTSKQCRKREQSSDEEENVRSRYNLRSRKVKKTTDDPDTNIKDGSEDAICKS